jgi:hypothetical protein
MPRAPRSTPKDKEIQALKDQLSRQDTAQAALLSQLGRQLQGTPGDIRARNLASGQMFVGVRNVSAYTISIPNTVTGEPAVNLHAPRAGVHDPNTVAIVSYAWWQHLRRGREYGRGMIVRDDSILGGHYEAAPPDDPRDCHPDHAANLVPDALEWIRARDDEAITADVARMTAEAPLRKLEAVPFKERERLMELHQALPWPDRKRRVEREMPSKYKHLKAVIVDRLAELEPKID